MAGLVSNGVARMTAKRPYLYYVTGYRRGERIARYYKTKEACDRMTRQMNRFTCALLTPITYEAIEAALSLYPNFEQPESATDSENATPKGWL
jgi:hypothetical protein